MPLFCSVCSSSVAGRRGPPAGASRRRTSAPTSRLPESPSAAASLYPQLQSSFTPLSSTTEKRSGRSNSRVDSACVRNVERHGGSDAVPHVTDASAIATVHHGNSPEVAAQPDGPVPAPSSLPPVPSSILVGSLTPPLLPVEAATRKSRCGGRTGDGTTAAAHGVQRGKVPLLDLDSVRLPAAQSDNPFSAAGLATPGDAAVDRDAEPPGVRSLPPTPNAHTAVDGSALSTSQAASHNPVAVARRTSVRFLSSSDGAVLPRPSLMPGDDVRSAERSSTCGSAGRHERLATPHRTAQVVVAAPRDWAVEGCSLSGSLRPDATSPPPSSASCCPTKQYEEGDGGEGEGFVPLSLSVAEDAMPTGQQRRGSGGGGGATGTQHGWLSGAASASGTSCPSPTSILLRSATAATNSSNGASAVPLSHPSWCASQSGAQRGGGAWGSRRASREGAAIVTPERRGSDASTPRFIGEDDGSSSSGGWGGRSCGSGGRAVLSRNDGGSDSDDERIIASVKATIERAKKSDGGSERPGLVRDRLPRRTQWTQYSRGVHGRNSTTRRNTTGTAN